MPTASYELSGIRLLDCGPDGPLLENDRDAIDFIAQAREQGATWIAIGTERLSSDFFRLKSGVAGAVLQKFLTYGVHVAILGDTARYQDESSAFRDFVVECNRGDHIWFVANLQELMEKLKQRAVPESQR